LSADYDYLPFTSWAGTMMANAARDPVFFAALTVANQDEPGIGTFCLRCHAPQSYVRGHATPPDGSAFDAIDEQGVGCDSCHRMLENPDLSATEPYLIGNSQVFYDENTAKRGPYDDATSPNHASLQQLSLGDSSMCGQCHQVSNPGKKLRDALGAETVYDFPLDTTYEEWAQSAYVPTGSDPKSCQDCHMPRKRGAWPIQTVYFNDLRTDPRSHSFVGGNHWGIRAVMETNPERATQYAGAFQQALDATLVSLESSVELTLTGLPSSVLPGDDFQATVRVKNLTGHKFPTGYAESRRAWIALVLVEPTLGQEHFVVGGFDPATGEIVEPEKTRVYRAQHGRWDGMAPEAEDHLALHDMVLLDTRIPPTGFVATPTTEPIGIDYGDGNGGFRDYDEATFDVSVPLSYGTELRVEARVYFQSMTKHYVDFLRVENTTDDRGEILHDAFVATGEAAPIEVASVGVDFGGGGGSGGSGGESPGAIAVGVGGSGGSGDGGSGASSPSAPTGGGCDCSSTTGSSGRNAGAALGLGALALAMGFGRRSRRQRS
jgi:MYXO-CTERM domain-containing protein